VTRVAVLDDYQRRAAQWADWDSLGPEVAVEFFAEPMSREELPSALAGFAVLVLMRERTKFPRAVLQRLPDLELVVTTGMQNASLDVGYLARARDHRVRDLARSPRSRGAEHRGGRLGARAGGHEARDARGPMIVNTSRGPILDEAALVDALRAA